MATERNDDLERFEKTFFELLVKDEAEMTSVERTMWYAICSLWKTLPDYRTKVDRLVSKLIDVLLDEAMRCPAEFSNDDQALLDYLNDYFVKDIPQIEVKSKNQAKKEFFKRLKPKKKKPL